MVLVSEAGSAQMIHIDQIMDLHKGVANFIGIHLNMLSLNPVAARLP